MRGLFLNTLSQNISFDSCGDIINPKLGQKGSRFVFHIAMVIKKMKVDSKGKKGR